ncbi:hypothetical protein AAY84_12310 [Serratia marcescens]|uniref:ParB/RepB/Spo0J family plasmid partition protein n=1 Tax=Serratia marcescens TaxID=615 RepID=UPI00062C8F3C|nr:ParB/RepB/Spo0J family plasmid partition protein [Serratia marcescens]KKZ18126.1 hypothetical protein AAY84_12310 [Serratia marcescens]
MAKRAFIKNAPQIDLGSAPENKFQHESKVAAPSVSALQSRVTAMSGDTVTLQINGRDVTLKMRVIPGEKTGQATMVYAGNERDQELLTESALADLIPTFKEAGQQFPAIGRMVNGIVEVADGSRRRATAILTKQPFKILIGELSNDDMAWLTKLGNDYQPTSAYERGKRYARLLKYEYDNNISALAKSEGVDRKIITRNIKVATLPIEVLKAFPAPHDLSARSGENLAALYKYNKNELIVAATDIFNRRISGEVINGEETLSQLKSSIVKNDKKKKVIKDFGAGVKAIYYEGSVSIQINDAPEYLLKELEEVLGRHKNKFES